MSRIRGIDTKIQKEVLQVRNGRNEIVHRNSQDQSSKTKDASEKQQITDLLVKLPKLDKIFEVHRKIGEGTFSSVYLGSLRQQAGLSDTEKRWFAIKHLVPTAHPARIEHELRCLQDMGGKHHVIGVELCLRHLDTIVFVMPYIPHKKFSEYVGLMDAAELQRYMRALLTALRHVHSFGVIHRDVKPSNFLYDRENQRYLLVDFGLAQRLCPEPPPPPAHSAHRKRPRDHEGSPPGAKRAALDLRVRTTPSPAIQGRMSRGRALAAAGAAMGADAGAAGAGAEAAGAEAGCACAGRGAVCGECGARAAPRAPRAGTQGFRPPEVLLKCQQQTTAVDTWAAGVVLLSALTARYPLLRAADDVAALAELAHLLGTRALDAAAAALGRRIVPSSPQRGLCFRKLCARLRGGPPPAAAPHDGGPAPLCTDCRLAKHACVCLDDDAKSEEWAEGAATCGFPDAAFALAAALLQPAPARRPSAAAALAHPFLAHSH